MPKLKRSSTINSENGQGARTIRPLERMNPLLLVILVSWYQVKVGGGRFNRPICSVTLLDQVTFLELSDTESSIIRTRSFFLFDELKKSASINSKNGPGIQVT